MTKIKLLARILTLGALGVMCGLVACGGGATEANSTSTLIITSTATLIPADRATLTPTTTATSTTLLSSTAVPPTATPNPIYLTPSTPEVNGQKYRLVEWSPEKAQEMIGLMMQYPDEIDYVMGFGSRETHYAHALLVPPHAEAILRYPNDERVESWRWNMGYWKTYGSNEEAGEFLLNLILEVLNSGEKQIHELPSWVEINKLELDLEYIESDYPSNYQSNYFIVIGHYYGGSVFWIRENELGFEGDVLFSAFDVYYHMPRVQLKDLTGDGIEELMITQPWDTAKWGSRETHYVYDLSQKTLRELFFSGENSGGNKLQEFFSELNELEKGIVGIETVSRPVLCFVEIFRTYRWNGEWFQRVLTKYSVSEKKNYASCYGASNAYWILDLEDTEFMISILPIYPPARSQYDYPPDAKDELRFVIGLNYALEGDYENSIETMKSIVEEPVIDTSAWISSAEQFLSIYQSTDDIYKACLQFDFCDLSRALERLVSEMAVEDFIEAIDMLKDSGVSILSSGAYRFDDASPPEQWLVIRPRPGDEMEFWILAETPDGVKALFVDKATNTNPILERFSEIKGRNLLLLDGKTYFTFHRLLMNNEPFVFAVETSNRDNNVSNLGPRDPLGAAISDVVSELLDGEDPELIIERMLAIEASVPKMTNWRFYYYLGLAYELAGDEQNAVAAYLEQWAKFPAEIEVIYIEFIDPNPYTMMARFKLELAP